MLGVSDEQQYLQMFGETATVLIALATLFALEITATRPFRIILREVTAFARTSASGPGAVFIALGKIRSISNRSAVIGCVNLLPRKTVVLRHSVARIVVTCQSRGIPKGRRFDPTDASTGSGV